MFGKNGTRRGRPREDGFLRRFEIYLAVAPLIMEEGARGLTMRRAAEAAHMSLGGIYHYFRGKRELVLYPLLPGVCQQQVEHFKARYGYLRDVEPRRYVDLFVDSQVQSVVSVRPAVHSAFELGAGEAWRTFEEGIEVELQDLIATVRELDEGARQHDPTLLGRTIRRLFLAALLDRTITEEEIRAELYTVLGCRPVQAEAAKSVNGGNVGTAFPGAI